MPGPVSDHYEGPRSFKPENPIEEGKSIIRVINLEGRAYVETVTYSGADRHPSFFTLTEHIEEALPYCNARSSFARFKI